MTLAKSWLVSVVAAALFGAPTQASNPQPRITRQCTQNAGGRLASVLKVYYPRFQQNGAGDTVVWFARKDLEAARHYLNTDPKNQIGWYSAAGQTCAAGDKGFPEYQKLQADFAKAEQEVKEMEAAKGVTFKELQNGNHVVYLDKSGRELPNSSQY